MLEIPDLLMNLKFKQLGHQFCSLCNVTLFTVFYFLKASLRAEQSFCHDGCALDTWKILVHKVCQLDYVHLEGDLYKFL